MSEAFSARLLAWFQEHRRDLPWRREPRDPYHVWISEIMLQQTRVETVIPYYERFLREFPTVEELAQAPESRVLACWSGLGYYSRARNLRDTAQRIVVAGAFPREYQAWRELPGIGPYTAAAIASIAFARVCPALDGNVMRVVARVTADASELGSSATRRRFEGAVRRWLDPQQPGLSNEALMELGATVCLPREPRCAACPVAACCRAHAEGRTAEFPVKPGKPEPRRVEVAFVVVEREGSVLLRQRGSHEKRLAGFWELPAPEQIPGLRDARPLGSFRHTITNNRYTCSVISATTDEAPAGMRWFAEFDLAHIPLSTASRKALRFVRNL